jgi:ferric-dicitrate binding protein FerR (iron transport regulator)
MDQNIPWKLLEKAFSNSANKNETEETKKWKDNAPENFIIFKQLENYFNETGTLPINFTPDTKDALKKVSEKTQFLPKTRQFQISNILWKAASILVLIAGGWYLVNNNIAKKSLAFSSILTSDTSKTNIVLSDGSHVWLNSNSSFKYPKKFGKNREVYLEGEAYFEIAHDPAHPFIVHASNTQTRVLGTKFNIRSYPSEKMVAITVSDGKVCFGISENKKATLIPGEKCVYNKQTSNIEKIENDDPNFMSWKTRGFGFHESTLESVFTTLAEVYHFKFHFENTMTKQRELTATFINRPLDEVLKTIAVSSELSIALQNGTYEIK